MTASVSAIGARQGAGAAIAAPGEDRTRGGMTAPAPVGQRLVLGVTGHRHAHLGDERIARLRVEVGSVLQAVEQHFAQVAEFRLVSSLASGADSVAADLALDMGWTLHAVLPAPREAYARDFADGEERAGFLRRLAAAAAAFELPCAEPSADAPHYERAGRVMLDQCDLLLALWDGQPARGRGGTAQIVAEAVSRHIPVLHVHADGCEDTVTLWSGFDRHGLACTEIATVGRAELGRLPELAAAMRVAAEQRGAAPPRRGGGPAWLYPLFLAAMGVRRVRASDFRPVDPSRMRAAMTAATEPICARSGAFGDRLRETLAPRYARADAEATAMGQLYRSGFVANFSLSALAVMLALAGLMVPPVLKPVLSAGEVGAVAAILWLTHVGRGRGWHRRWIEQRHLAERLRCLALAAQLGDLSPSFGRIETGADAELRGLARALGLPSVRVDGDYLACVRAGLTAMLDDQVAYNFANARRMHRLDHRLHRIGTLLFALGAAVTLCVLLLEIGVHATGSHRLEALSPHVTLGATVLSAFLPAIGAAIYGIRMQGDFSGVAARSHVLAEALASLRAGADAHEATSEDAAFDQLRQFIGRATGLMNAELADWRTAHSARPLTLPG